MDLFYFGINTNETIKVYENVRF